MRSMWRGGVLIMFGERGSLEAGRRLPVIGCGRRCVEGSRFSVWLTFTPRLPNTARRTLAKPALSGAAAVNLSARARARAAAALKGADSKACTRIA